jgi:hypothetical protein
MEDEKAIGQSIAGRTILILQFSAGAAFLVALWFAGESFEKPEYATPAGVMMIAAVLGFGLLANAVLRR